MASGSKSGADELCNLLNTCLELIEAGEVSIEALLAGYNELRDSLQPPLEAALWLYGRSWLFDPRPAFVSACRSRIVGRVQSESRKTMTARSRGQQPEISRYRRWNSFSLWIALVSILVLVWVGAKSLAFWVGNSVPGDPLHRIKLAQEQLQMAFSFSAQADAESSIRFVGTRLIETERLIIAGRESYFPAAVGNLDMRLEEAVHAVERLAERDPEQADLYGSQLEGTLLRESEKLSALRGFYPPTTRQMIDQVLALSSDALQAIDMQD